MGAVKESERVRQQERKITAKDVYEHVEAMVGKAMKEAVEQLKEEMRQSDETRKKELSELFAPSRSRLRQGTDLAPEKLGRHDERGIKAARFVRSLVATKFNPSAAADFCKKTTGDETVAKALAASDLSAGGAIIPPDFAADVIDALRDMSTVLSFDPNQVPMPNGTYTQPYVSTGVSMTWAGENEETNATQPATGQLNMTARKGQIVVAVGNDLIRFGGPESDRMIRDDIIGAFAEGIDLKALRGTGLEDTPKGLLNWSGTTQNNGGRFNAANALDAADGSTLAEISNDLGKAIQKVLDNKLKVPSPTRAGWIFSIRTWRKLAFLRDGLGANFVFYDEMARGSLLGFRWARTTQVPNTITLDAKTDCSEVYFCSFGEGFLWGRSGEMEFDAYKGGAYKDSGGTMRSGITSDQTVVSGIIHVDFGCRYRGGEVAVIEKVRWGSP